MTGIVKSRVTKAGVELPANFRDQDCGASPFTIVFNTAYGRGKGCEVFTCHLWNLLKLVDRIPSGRGQAKLALPASYHKADK
jgi:hypothetical protein